MTMMIRVKLVIMMRMAGARERTVRRTMICIAEERFSRRERSGSWRARLTSDSFAKAPAWAAVLAGVGGVAAVGSVPVCARAVAEARWSATERRMRICGRMLMRSGD